MANYITIVRRKITGHKVKGHRYPQIALPAMLKDCIGKDVIIRVRKDKKYIELEIIE